MHEFVGYIVLFPLVGFAINGLVPAGRVGEKVSGVIGSGAVGLSFVLSAAMFLELLGNPVDQRLYIVRLFEWIAAGSMNLSVGYQVDQLSTLMTLIITGVGFLIHVYSMGYMHGDPGFSRFFAYLNLFIFMMLNLVLAENFLLMFLGWEGVGLCSFLLIGFWHDRKFDTGGYSPGTATTTDAAKKAFVVNRIGDFGFLVAMFMLFSAFGSLNFLDIFSRAPHLFSTGDTTIVLITLLLFLGATGKSAQIPLFVWLPDAMAGPTPVSALIHAATMVTAGVYMVARCSVLFALAPTTLFVVAVIGLATAFMAASIGIVQNDIKKVLAYSTVSQLGYLFLGLGVGAFSGGLFHVMTHAFFKALLFLGAGSVIHAMHGEQDIQKMGGLRGHLPWTHKTFLVGALAIAGIPPLAGFFSKDEILWHSFLHGSLLFWVVGWVVAGITAFYMFRLFFLVFEGESRWVSGVHPHESPKTMTVPLVLLAFLSVAGGWVGIPASLGGVNLFERWLEPVFEPALQIIASHQNESHATEYILMVLSVVIAVSSILLARMIYLKRTDLSSNIAAKFQFLHKILANKYYVDELYDAAVVLPVVRTSNKLLWKVFDIRIIDGAVNGTARLMNWMADVLRRLQGGVVQGYALAFVMGIVIILGIMLFR